MTPDQLLMSAEEVRASAQSLSLFEGFPLFAASSCYPLLFFSEAPEMPDQSRSWTHRYTDDTQMIHMFCLFSIVFLNCGEAPAEYLDLAVPENPDQWNRCWSLEVSAITKIMSSAWPFLQASPG